MIPPELRAAFPIWRTRGVYRTLLEPGVALAIAEARDPYSLIRHAASLYSLPLGRHQERLVVVIAKTLVRVGAQRRQ